MAYVTKRGGKWAARWKDAHGNWREERLTHGSKTEARHYALEQEKTAERQRKGLDPLAGTGDDTFEDLFTWWWDEYGRRLRSTTVRSFARKHLISTIGKLRVREVTAAKLEGVMNSRADDLAPRSINHLRGLVHVVYSKAIRRGKWTGTNPAAAVERRKVIRGKPEYLRPEEVTGLIVALDPRWRPLFATAALTGMRKGELLGLRKTDVNIAERTIMVARSYDHETTKGGHTDLLPVPDLLIPWLEEALHRSPSPLVFPRPDGSMHSTDLALDEVLRRALGRAGVVTGYEHRCRRKGCGYRKLEPSADGGRCPKCNMKLWAKPLPRHVRFHDLRHTTATLLLKAGVPLATVQRVLRHSDPRLTAMTYGHLDVSDMRAGMNGLALAAIGNLPVAARRLLASNDLRDGAGEVLEPDFQRVRRASVGRDRSGPKDKAPGAEAFACDSEGFDESGRQDLNLRPLGPEPSRAASHVPHGGAPERKRMILLHRPQSRIGHPSHREHAGCSPWLQNGCSDRAAVGGVRDRLERAAESGRP
jgi:integrase